MIATSYVFDPFIRFSSDAREAYQRVRNSGLYNPRVSGRRSPIPLLALAGILSLSRCGGEKTPGAEGIQVGFYGALTGPTATFALSGKNGVALAIEELNAAGGVLGGKRMELLVEDDRGEATEAASAVSKLITRDHVVALIGEQASSRTIAAAPIAQSYRVPMISPTSTNVEVTKKGDYIFRVCFTDPYQGAVISTFARNNLQAKTAAQLVDVRNDYSVGLAQAFRESFTKSGGRVVADLKYSEGDSDFSAQITAIRPLDPDVLVVPGYYTDAGLIARQAKALGLRAVLLGGDGWDSPTLTEIGGHAVEGAYFRRCVGSSPHIERNTASRPIRSPLCPMTPPGCSRTRSRGPARRRESASAMRSPTRRATRRSPARSRWTRTAIRSSRRWSSKSKAAASGS